jgi:hypothetical protein
MDNSLMARPHALFGKATETVKTMLPGEVRDDFARRWREMGCESESAALRDLILIATYGADHIASLQAARVRGMAQRMSVTSTETATDGVIGGAA